MTTLFAYLHHLWASTLVGALAIEFALIRQESAVRLNQILLRADT
jgi:putative membrane protein